MANQFYVAISDGHMMRLFTYEKKMKELYHSGKIEEYRRCDSRKQADEYCNIYNNGGLKNETV